MTDDTTDGELDALVRTIPEGWSRTMIDGRPWAITRTTRAGGKVISVDAERLGDHTQLGANVWLTTEGAVLRPCEVPAEDVMRILRAASAALSGNVDR
jgi:peptide-methionine (S)-S-oxide reductase